MVLQSKVGENAIGTIEIKLIERIDDDATNKWTKI